MALTDVTVRNAKAAVKHYKLADSLGLYLYVQPSGSKLWRRNYRFEGKQKTLALGQYPKSRWPRHESGLKKPAACWPME